MKYLKKIFFLLIVVSCNNDSDDEIFLSGNKSLFSYSIQEFPHIKFSGLNQNKLTATLDQSVSLNELTAVFEVSEGANVFIGNTRQESGVSKNNFNNVVTYTIEAEDGSTNEFTVQINPVPNTPPVADAGDDRLVFLDSGNVSVDVTLDASSSFDIDSDSLTYEWIINNNVVSNNKTTTVNLSLGIYNVELVVSDGNGGTSRDNITIEVKELPIQIAIDETITPEAQNLLTNLVSLTLSDEFIFGQEFPLTFKLNGVSYDLNTSDCKDVTGDLPGVFGIDPHYMLYKGQGQRELHINESKLAYENGSIVTFDFHQRSRSDGEIYFDRITTDTDRSLVYDIVNDLNGARNWYLSEIDQVLEIINIDLDFPIIFRPLHEMNGNWFWWGTKTSNHTPSLYIDLFRLTVDYMKERTDNVLYAWSPNWEIEESYYPGDNYVDVVGIDFYGASKSNLGQNLRNLTLFSEQHNKVSAFTETGDQGYINTNPDFWTDDILSVIESAGTDIRLAWVLGWFNAPWDNGQENLFIPNSESPQIAKDDFIEFKSNDKVLFQSDLLARSIYD